MPLSSDIIMWWILGATMMGHLWLETEAQQPALTSTSTVATTSTTTEVCQLCMKDAAKLRDLLLSRDSMDPQLLLLIEGCGTDSECIRLVTTYWPEVFQAICDTWLQPEKSCTLTNYCGPSANRASRDCSSCTTGIAQIVSRLKVGNGQSLLEPLEAVQALKASPEEKTKYIEKVAPLLGILSDAWMQHGQDICQRALPELCRAG